jgi:signal transduction histidine kinase
MAVARPVLLMRPRSSATYFAASIVLLIVVIAIYAGTTARRTQAALRAQLEDKGLALADAFQTSSRNAIRSDALLEEALARRLFDNARLVDELLQRGADPDQVRALAQRNGLRRIDLLDRDGRAWTPPAAPPSPMRPGMRMGGGDMPPGMMRYMWGRRWARPPESLAEAPSTIRDRRFWQGTVFGVAIGARSFEGIIAVHADADDVLSFRREVGVQRQLEELARQAGVVAVAVLGADRSVLASAGALAGVADDPALARALDGRRSVAGFVGDGAGRRFRIARPLALGAAGGGLLTIDFSSAPMARAWRHDVRAGLALASAALAAGALGLGLIFYVQHRRLREVRALEVEMARRERLAALGDVAAAFAHEVRNPLNAVSMGLQRLRAEFAPEPAADYARFVDLMQGEVRRLNAIVEQFIALARPLPLKPVAVDVADLLHALAALVEGQAREAGVGLRVEVPADPPTVTADRDHLQQVLLNLALNAVQAMRGGGRLTLAAERARDRVVLSVSDTGPGIAPDVLPRIFDPYFTTKPGGLGLGLTIARRIVEAHGGTLEAGPAPGGGARFRVVLPLTPP